MQYYKNIGDDVSDSAMYGTHYVKGKDNKEISVDNKFSQVGCKEAGVAKIISQLENRYVDMKTAQGFCDTNMDGDLDAAEISKGLNEMLDTLFDDIFDVKYKDIKSKINVDTLEDIASKKDGEITYVLGFAPDCHGGHWVVLEGFTQNSNGSISFNYDGTSDNDVGRSFVLGKDMQNKNSETWGITRIQTFTVYQK